MSAQISQIRDLHCKLNAAIMENPQMWEFLNPSMLQNVITNALQAAQLSSCHHGNNGLGTREGKPFLGRPQEPQLSAGKNGTMDPEKTCHYCKDTGHKLNNCLCLQCKKELLNCKHSGEGLN